MNINIDLGKTQTYLEWTKTMIYLDTTANSARRKIIKRGEVFKCKLGSGVGSEESKERPCVILQGDAANKASSNTIVAPITHSTSHLPIVIPIIDKVDTSGKMILDGNVLLGNIVTVSKARLGTYICNLTSDEMNKVDIALSISIDIKRHYDKLNNIYNDKLDYIEKLKIKNEQNENEVLVLNEVKELFNVTNTEDLIVKIKEAMDKK
jgi:mRNA interferase MazF